MGWCICVACQDEWGPLAEWTPSADALDLGLANRRVRGKSLIEIRMVEPVHELGRGSISDFPQRDEKGAGPGIEECPGQSDDALSPRDASKPGVAGRQHDEIGGGAELEDLVHLKKPVFDGILVLRQAESAHRRLLLVNEPMCGEVDV